MPEGDAVKRLEQQFRSLLGEVLEVTSPQGRFVDGAAQLNGKTLADTDTQGKHLFLRFGDDLWLRIHLGLYGRVLWQEKVPPDPPLPNIRIRFVGDTWTADLRGPNQCEIIDDARRVEIKRNLGVDPLKPEESIDQILEWLGRSPIALTHVLLMQDVFAGVGNIYRSEIPFRACIDPWTAANQITEKEWRRMWEDLQQLMSEGVENGMIVTTRPPDRSSDSLPVSPEDRFYVYGREGSPCRICGTTVMMSPVAGRKMFWCPFCQNPALRRVSL